VDSVANTFPTFPSIRRAITNYLIDWKLMWKPQLDFDILYNTSCILKKHNNLRWCKYVQVGVQKGVRGSEETEINIHTQASPSIMASGHKIWCRLMVSQLLVMWNLRGYIPTSGSCDISFSSLSRSSRTGNSKFSLIEWRQSGLVEKTGGEVVSPCRWPTWHFILLFEGQSYKQSVKSVVSLPMIFAARELNWKLLHFYCCFIYTLAPS
jgi:hypothetical protein